MLMSDQFPHHFYNTNHQDDSNTNKAENLALYNSYSSNRRRELSSSPTDKPLNIFEYWVKRIQKFLNPNLDLRTSCIDEYTKRVELGILYDASYCVDNGNTKELAEESITNLVLNINGEFATTYICITFEIMHLDGECGSQDLVGNIVAIQNSEDRLFQFGEFWRLNKNDEFNVDAAILISGEGTIMIDDDGSRFYGKAYNESICTLTRKYGVAALTKVDNRKFPPPPEVVIAHELGHILGANHDEEEGANIMQEKLDTFSGYHGFSFNSLIDMENHFDSLLGEDFNCVQIGGFDYRKSVAIGVENMASLGFVSSIFFSTILVVGYTFFYKARRYHPTKNSHSSISVRTL